MSDERPVRKLYLAHVDTCTACNGIMLCDVARRLKLAEQLEAAGWKMLAREVVS